MPTLSWLAVAFAATADADVSTCLLAWDADRQGLAPWLHVPAGGVRASALHAFEADGATYAEECKSRRALAHTTLQAQACKPRTTGCTIYDCRNYTVVLL